MRVRKMKRGKRGVSQNVRERKRKGVSGWVCGVRRHWLVEAGEEPKLSAWYENRQSSVPQPSPRFNSAGKELLFPPPKSALSSSPLPLHPSPHPSPSLFYRLTASLRLSNTFKQARWAQ